MYSFSVDLGDYWGGEKGYMNRPAIGEILFYRGEKGKCMLGKGKMYRMGK
jgi:hypothetical protein